MRLRLNLRVSFGWAALGMMSLTLAQDAEPLTEAFLLFLAEGVEVDGEWQDPVSLAGMAALQDLPEDELVWIAERDTAELDEISNGEEDE